jgi:predicted RNase H-like nuclease (RuvC/YqgF family)
LSEPTAADAVAGMLFRHGFDVEARGVCEYPDRLPWIAERLRTAEPSPERDACIAALEALARGDDPITKYRERIASLRSLVYGLRTQLDQRQREIDTLKRKLAKAQREASIPMRDLASVHMLAEELRSIHDEGGLRNAVANVEFYAATVRPVDYDREQMRHRLERTAAWALAAMREIDRAKQAATLDAHAADNAGADR